MPHKASEKGEQAERSQCDCCETAWDLAATPSRYVSPAEHAPVTQDLATVPGGDALLAECITAKHCCAASVQIPKIATGHFTSLCSASLCLARPTEIPETAPSSCETMLSNCIMYGCCRAHLPPAAAKWRLLLVVARCSAAVARLLPSCACHSVLCCAALCPVYQDP